MDYLPRNPRYYSNFLGEDFIRRAKALAVKSHPNWMARARAAALCATVLFGTAGMKTAECDKCAEIRIVHAPLFLPLLSLLIPPLLHNTYIICYIVQSIVLCI